MIIKTIKKGGFLNSFKNKYRLTRKVCFKKILHFFLKTLNLINKLRFYITNINFAVFKQISFLTFKS